MKGKTRRKDNSGEVNRHQCSQCKEFPISAKNMTCKEAYIHLFLRCKNLERKYGIPKYAGFDNNYFHSVSNIVQKGENKLAPGIPKSLIEQSEVQVADRLKKLVETRIAKFLLRHNLPFEIANSKQLSTLIW